MDNLSICADHVEDGAVSSPSSLVASPGTWPGLDGLVLGAVGRGGRRSFIGGSDANVILSGDAEKLVRLWREKRGEIESEDLSSSLAVMLGCWTEAFNRQWFERLSGEQVSGVGASMTCSKHGWRRCTLDGVVERSGAVWEAKHTSAFAKPDEVLERYMPQLQHNMAVAGAETAILSVIFGNHKYEIIEVASDWLYQLELLDAEHQFWDCVVTGREPVPVASPPPPRPIGPARSALRATMHGHRRHATGSAIVPPPRSMPVR